MVETYARSFDRMHLTIVTVNVLHSTASTHLLARVGIWLSTHLQLCNCHVILNVTNVSGRQFDNRNRLRL